MRAIAKQISTRGQAHSVRRRGFTLIELLVVLALTAILFTVIFKPLVDSYNLTARAGTQIDSQATTRSTLAEITRVLSNAETVYDPTSRGANSDASLNLWLTDGTGNPFPLASEFTMLEYVPAAHQLDQTPYVGGSPLPVDPTTGEPISGNLLNAAQSGLALPLTSGRLLGRIWPGLINNASVNDSSGAGLNGMPAIPYGNHFEDTGLALNRDNRYTLYKAEVTTYIQDPTAASVDVNTPYVANLCLFHTDTGLKNGNLIVHDPNFFYDNSLAGGNEGTKGTSKWAVPGWRDINGDGKVQVWENWRAVATSLTPTNKIDLIALERDPNNNGVNYYDNSGALSSPPAAGSKPKVSSMVSFKPSFVQNDPGVPTALDNAGNETPDPASPAYSTQYGQWAQTYRVFVYRADPNNPGQDPTTRSPLDYYEGIWDKVNQRLKIVHVAPAMGITPGNTPPDANGLPDIGPQLTPTPAQLFSNPNTNNSTNTQFAFVVSQTSGLVNFSFSSLQVVHDALGNGAPQRYSPDDVNTAGAALDPPRRFLYLPAALPATSWGAFPSLNLAGLKSPLDPSQSWAGVYSDANGIQHSTVRIVPGSEKVFGPDQRQGIHYGQRIQYTRVSGNAGTAGPNQYRINYEDNLNMPAGSADLRLRMGYIEFDSQPDGAIYNFATMASPSLSQGQHSLPIYKFNPATLAVDNTLPADPVEISFNFQMNRPGDVIKADYLTRQLIVFSLQTRLYDLASYRPQITRVTEKIQVRNLQR